MRITITNQDQSSRSHLDADCPLLLQGLVYLLLEDTEHIAAIGHRLHCDPVFVRGVDLPEGQVAINPYFVGIPFDLEEGPTPEKIVVSFLWGYHNLGLLKGMSREHVFSQGHLSSDVGVEASFTQLLVAKLKVGVVSKTYRSQSDGFRQLELHGQLGLCEGEGLHKFRELQVVHLGSHSYGRLVLLLLKELLLHSHIGIQAVNGQSVLVFEDVLIRCVDPVDPGIHEETARRGEVIIVTGVDNSDSTKHQSNNLSSVLEIQQQL